MREPQVLMKTCPSLPFQTMTRQLEFLRLSRNRDTCTRSNDEVRKANSLSLPLRHASLTSFFDSYSATSFPPRITLRDVIILRATCSFHSRLFPTFIPRPLLFDLIPVLPCTLATKLNVPQPGTRLWKENIVAVSISSSSFGYIRQEYISPVYSRMFVLRFT